MKTASVSDLKAHLARYLGIVKRGGEVQVHDRGVPVARLVGLAGGERRGDDRRQRLVRAGLLRPGSGDASWILREPPVRVTGSTLSSALEEDRKDRV